MKITITKKQPAAFGGTWYTGWTGYLDFQAKVYDTGSPYGILGGRVSKLTITHAVSGAVLASYDRGWDVRPARKADQAALDAILAALN